MTLRANNCIRNHYHTILYTVLRPSLSPSISVSNLLTQADGRWTVDRTRHMTVHLYGRTCTTVRHASLVRCSLFMIADYRTREESAVMIKRTKQYPPAPAGRWLQWSMYLVAPVGSCRESNKVIAICTCHNLPSIFWSDMQVVCVIMHRIGQGITAVSH